MYCNYRYEGFLIPGVRFCTRTTSTVCVYLSHHSVISPCLLHASLMLAPTLTVIVRPAEVIALDHRQFNIFTLRCIANASEGVMLPKSFIWRNGDDVISDNGNTILIAYHNTTLPSSISELTVRRQEIGTYMYLCEVSISVPGGHNISISNTGSVTVKGNILKSHS